MFCFIVFNFSMVDGFACVVDRQRFQSLVEKVFVDSITWGEIITLICVIGRTVATVCSVCFLSLSQKHSIKL